jgi:hypothetical protein
MWAVASVCQTYRYFAHCSQPGISFQRYKGMNGKVPRYSSATYNLPSGCKLGRCISKDIRIMYDSLALSPLAIVYNKLTLADSIPAIGPKSMVGRTCLSSV